jgi:hypothetical protein
MKVKELEYCRRESKMCPGKAEDKIRKTGTNSMDIKGSTL